MGIILFSELQRGKGGKRSFGEGRSEVCLFLSCLHSLPHTTLLSFIAVRSLLCCSLRFMWRIPGELFEV